MSIDRDRMLRVMLAAAREAAGKSWRGVEACVEAAVGEEAGFLSDLAEAVLAGEVGEEEQEFLDLLQRALRISDDRASHIDAVLAELAESKQGRA